MISTFKWYFDFLDILLFFIFLPLPFFFNVVAWHLVTRSQGEKISFSKNFEVWMLSNFARYLPGGIWQYPSRVLLLSKERVSKEATVKCLVLEALFVVFAGLLVVFSVFVSGGLGLSPGGVNYLLVALLSSVLFFFLTKNQSLMNILGKLFSKVAGKKRSVKGIEMSLGWAPVLTLAYFLAFLFPSVILFLLAKGVVTLTLNLLPLFIGAYAASWLLGYVAFFAPAGIGVREAALASFLSVYMPFSVAAVLVIALRIALLAAEALGFGFAVLLSKNKFDVFKIF